MSSEVCQFSLKMIEYIVCVTNKAGKLWDMFQWWPVAQNVNPFCHLPLIVLSSLCTRNLLGETEAKRWKGTFSQQMLCTLWNKICCTFWWCSYEKLNFSSFTKGSGVMKKLVLLSVLQKSLQVWVWEWREVWWWALINFTFTTLFPTPKIIIPVRSSSCQFHRLKESQPTNLVSGHESWCTLISNPI